MQPNLWAQLPTGVLPWYMGPTLQCTVYALLIPWAYYALFILFLYRGHTLQYIFIVRVYALLKPWAMGHTMNCVYFTYYCALYVLYLYLWDYYAVCSMSI